MDFGPTKGVQDKQKSEIQYIFLSVKVSFRVVHEEKKTKA